jgi:hypothetical protein
VTILREKVPGVVSMSVAVLEDRTVLLFSTVPEADRAKAEPGFDLVIDSLAVAAK